MRSIKTFVVVGRVLAAGAAGALSVLLSGCGHRDAATPSDVGARPVCECGAPVTTLAAPVEPTIAEAPRRGVRLQETVSLGYAGDAPLTQIEPRREWWGDPDGAYAVYGGYGAYGVGYGGRGSRGSRGSRGARTIARGSNGTQGFGGAAPIQHGMGGRMGSAPGPSAPSAASTFHGPR
jgi:hypothetical protein